MGSRRGASILHRSMCRRAGAFGRRFHGVFPIAAGLMLLALPWGLSGCAGSGSGEGTLPVTVTFDSSLEAAENTLRLGTPGIELPTDWTGYEALVMELRASSPQRMSLKIYNKSDESGKPSYSRVLLHPYPKVWIRAAIPVELLTAPPSTGHDMAAVGNRSRPGYFLGLWGPFVPLTSVESIGFEMQNPIGSPTLEIRSVRLEKVSPGDAVLDGLPLVDEFGQYIHSDWPDKAKSAEQLAAAWSDESAKLAPGDFGYCSYGGYTNTRAKATGFFRVEKIDGRWWFVDPDGHLFLSAGADVMRPDMVTRSRGRDAFFKELPPGDLRSGRGRGDDPGVSFLTWNISRRYGSDWQPGWADTTFRRMAAWGLNTVGNWSDPRLWDAHLMPYVIPLSGWQTEVDYLGLPDVYSEDFVRLSDERAQEQCAGRKDDPWLLGYFLANEPPFPQKARQTVELIMAGPETATKQKLSDWLAEADTPERREEFIGEALDRYIQVTSAAVRKHDPNHLNLGMRSGGHPTESEIRAARAFDVYSVNIYDYQVGPERVQAIANLCGKPILIGEFHLGTPGRGLAASLVQVRDATERAKGYRFYVEQAFSIPELIGTHWFQWADQPCTGRFDGENYNIGFIDVTDRPYANMVDALQETHQRLYRVHLGEAEPYSERPAVN